jgi:hypothetical protein
MSSERDEMLLRFEQKLARIGSKISAEDASLLIAEDFVEFGASGQVWSKAEIVQEMAEWMPNEAVIESFRVRDLSPAVCLVTYKLVGPVKDGQVSNRSSIWRYTGNRWEIIFHQGTIVAP